ncbi:hypothetical protein OAG_05635 [Vibrio cyclitrophicus FF75]|nr:hypothetical protein OAG_05635 [Vibrio cyclitrophicus FF75]
MWNLGRRRPKILMAKQSFQTIMNSYQFKKNVVNKFGLLINNLNSMNLKFFEWLPNVKTFILSAYYV